MSFCLTKITSFSPRHSVILSSKNICLSPSLCYSVFKKNICLPLSLCHSVLQKSPVSLPVTLLFCLQKTSVSLCHYVIMSSKKHLSPFVIMSLCLQKNICLPLRPSVILSKNAPVGDGSGPSCCCCYFFSVCLISIFHKLCYVLPHYLSSIYSFLQGR